MDNNQYYKSRHFLRLLHRYEKSVAEGHTPYLEADELTDIAEYYMTDRQDAKANQAIQTALDLHPGSIDPQIFLARQKMFCGKLGEAHGIIETIAEQNDSEVIYVRAELLIKEGHADEASDFLLDRMRLMQDSLDTYLYDSTSIFMDYDQWELAEEWLEHLKDAFPAHPRLPIMDAEIRMGLDDYGNALPKLRKLLEDEPYNSEAWKLLAETCIALDMLPEALDAADYSLAINPQDSDALLLKGNAFMHGEQTAEAIEHYKEYLEAQPDDLGAQISLAVCYTNEERCHEVLPLLEKAERYARQLPDGDTCLPQILCLRAYALGHIGKTAEALAANAEARKLDDDNRTWKYDMTDGEIYLMAGMTKRAEECFTAALEKSPGKGETLFSIALSYFNADYFDTAIDLFDDVWSILGPQEGKIVVPYLASCYLHKHDTENFLNHLKLAPHCDRDATIHLFRDHFPGIAPEDYYAHAYKEIHGIFPVSDEDQS